MSAIICECPRCNGQVMWDRINDEAVCMQCSRPFDKNGNEKTTYWEAPARCAEAHHKNKVRT